MSTLSRITKSLGWSWRIPIAFQIQKYTLSNITRYLHYITTISSVPLHRLKFADESHILAKEIGVGRYVLGLKNTRTWVRRNNLDGSRATVTILTSLAPGSNHLFIDFNEDVHYSISLFLLFYYLEK